MNTREIEDIFNTLEDLTEQRNREVKEIEDKYRTRLRELSDSIYVLQCKYESVARSLSTKKYYNINGSIKAPQGIEADFDGITLSWYDGRFSEFIDSECIGWEQILEEENNSK